jgi:hypothetical protein
MQIYFRLFTLVTFFLNIHFLYSAERGSSSPFISGDTFRAFADHIFDETKISFKPRDVKEGDVIFIKTDYNFLESFFYRYHPHIRHKYIIVTHNSDHSTPGPFYEMLNSNKIIAWFGQNIEGKSHPKLFNIPIGIANQCWVHGNVDVFSKYSNKRGNIIRPYLCYMNFSCETYPKERTQVRDCFLKYSWCKKAEGKNLESYLEDMSKSKFVLSPRGNGLDCHRTWEALLMGAIPIVKASSLDPLYKDLPVLIVDDWEIITKKFLEEKYKEMQNQEYNCAKIFSSYWINFIKKNLSASLSKNRNICA